MHITCMATDEGPSSYIQRTFDVKHVNSKEVLSVTHIQMKKWNPDTNLEGIVSVFKDVDMMHKRGQCTQPIVIHCINGFDRSGVVVTVISELERITVTERIDVFSTVKKLRDQHEHMLKNTDDYILCYHLLKAYLTSSNSDYENVDDIRHK
ncbi:Receptor-type tyrosine-protein phosphatase F [Holothuria leucospilota]|uniref:Receptor-type tyrosine-protein phosphatase F n=1 Tax=Holothuria leucospilota TaxID=206669 RepID=A0A9Q1HCK0_HOLLE|nr:Receptor-type tyrosine-protein phosphatase F [Holothuria leucospilota]